MTTFTEHEFPLNLMYPYYTSPLRIFRVTFVALSFEPFPYVLGMQCSMLT